MAKKITVGIYDKPNGISVKIVKVYKNNGVQGAEAYFTNNPQYGKGHWKMEGKYLQSFMKDFKKRK